MKRVLFVGQSLKIGGVEKALVEQLNSLDKDTYCVDLFLFSPTGGYINELSSNIHVLKSPFVLQCAALTNTEAKMHLRTFILRSLLYIISRIIGNRKLYTILFLGIKTLGHYDKAISYFHDGMAKGLYYGCNLFVLNKVDAKSKIAWIHSDPQIINISEEVNKDIYKRFDAVVSVSYAMKRKIDEMGIFESGHSFVVYNRYDGNKILQLAKEGVVAKHDKFTIVTVGRLEYYKGTMELLKIACRLRENGMGFVWLFIGTGCQQEEAMKFVRDNELSENVLFIGQITNPYPYIKNAELMVSGSITETFGLSILEALVLNTPVIAYKYEAIGEVVKNERNGIIVNTYDELYKRLLDILSGEKKIDSIIERSEPLYDYNSLNKEQFDNLIESI